MQARTKTARCTTTVAPRFGSKRLVAHGVALALTAFALGACSSDDDDDTGGGTDGDMGMDGSPTGDFAVVANDGASPGSVQFFSPDLATGTTLEQTGLNQGIAFGPDGTLYQNSDAEDMTGLFMITEGSTPTQIGLFPGKGLSFLTGQNLLASCDFADATGTAELKLFSPDAIEDATDVAAAPVATVDLPAPCWDTFWSEDDERLYAALTDGTLAILDEFSANDPDDTDMAGTMVDRTVTPVDAMGETLSTNFHGVFVEDGTVLVSDVGSADSPDDGLLFVFEDDGTLNGDIETQSVGGPATMLGNPVDVVLLDGAAIVAEKSNDAILVFEDVANLTGDVMPDYTQSFTKPESIELAPADGGATTGTDDGTTGGTDDGTTTGTDDGTTGGTDDGTTTGTDDGTTGGTDDGTTTGTDDGTTTGTDDGTTTGGTDDGTTTGTDGTTTGTDGTTTGTDGTTTGADDTTTGGGTTTGTDGTTTGTDGTTTGADDTTTGGGTDA